MFASGVISFRRGLMDPHTADDFKSYLREEVVRGSGGSHKKVVGTKVRGQIESVLHAYVPHTCTCINIRCTCIYMHVHTLIHCSYKSDKHLHVSYMH